MTVLKAEGAESWIWSVNFIDRLSLNRVQKTSDTIRICLGHCTTLGATL
jgi:hypothetical protein